MRENDQECPILEVKYRLEYGSERYMAHNAAAKELRQAFAYRKGMVSFTREQLGVLSKLGVRIEIVPEERQVFHA